MTQAYPLSCVAIIEIFYHSAGLARSQRVWTSICSECKWLAMHIAAHRKFIWSHSIHSLTVWTAMTWLKEELLQNGKLSKANSALCCADWMELPITSNICIAVCVSMISGCTICRRWTKDVLAILLEWVASDAPQPVRRCNAQTNRMMFVWCRFFAAVKDDEDFLEAVQLRQELSELFGMHVVWKEYTSVLQTPIDDDTDVPEVLNT